MTALSGRQRRSAVFAMLSGIFVIGVVALILVAGFRQTADVSWPIGGSVATVYITVLVAVMALKSASAEPTADSLSHARSRLRSVVDSEVAKQARALIARGVLTVPWTGSQLAAESSLSDLAYSVGAGGQLIVFGESQSGKTTLAVRLAQELAAQSARQPVLFSLSTWPRNVKLQDWMMHTLQSAYGLGSASDAEIANETFRDGGIVPILDGLDEIDASDRREAADIIHLFIGDNPAVLTSIPTPETELAARAALSSGEIIRLSPATPESVAEYLLAGALAEQDELAALGSYLVTDRGSEVSKALSSPLMAWLAKTIYALGAYSPDSGIARPTELADLTMFPDAESIETHLLRSLPTAAFGLYKISQSTTSGPRSAVFKPEQADRWLGFLAVRATKRIIAFWEFRGYAPLFRIALLGAAVAGCLIAIVGADVPYLSGVGYFALLAGAFFGFGWADGYAATRDKVNDPQRIGFGYAGRADGDRSLHLRRLAHGITAAVVAYAAGVVTQVVRGHPDLSFGLSGARFGAAAAFATILCFAVANFGARTAARILLRSSRMDSLTGANAADPLAAIVSDRRSGAVILAVATITLGAGIAVYDALFLSMDAAWNVLMAPVGALAAAFIWNEWICFKVAHRWLAFRGRLPHRLSKFLWQCHQVGILRKNGNHFEFRHRRLQDSLRVAEEARRRC